MTLVESIAAAFVHTCALALLSSTLVLSASSAGERQRVIGRAATELQVESLLRAWTEHTSTIWISRASPRVLQMRSDLDGDGRIDERSTEQLTLTLEPAAPAAGESLAAGSRQLLALRHRIGRQTYTVARGLPAGSSFRYIDLHGRTASRPDSSVIVGVPLATGPVLLGVGKRHEP
jgi:hypothetical protein